jgi:hypothetical protein
VQSVKARTFLWAAGARRLPPYLLPSNSTDGPVELLGSKLKGHFDAGMTLRILNQPSEPFPTHSPTFPLSRSFKSSTVRAGLSEAFTKAETLLPLMTSFSFTHDSGSGAGVIADSYLPG